MTDTDLLPCQTKNCPDCGGTGVVQPCDTCENKGWVDDPSDGGTMGCPDCDGEPCRECEGTGYVEQN